MYHTLLHLWLVSLLSFSFATLAADIASDVRTGTGHLNENGGYFEVGLISAYVDSPYENSNIANTGWQGGPDLGGEYRYNGFFIEASQGTQDGLNIGYTLWRNNEWSIDILAPSMSGELVIGDDNDFKESDTETERNKKIREQDTLYIGMGLRATRYYKNYVLQYRLISDVFDNNGIVSTLRLGRNWQIRNWNIHTIVSAEYTSQKANNYWFGIDASEQSVRFPMYQPDDSLNASLVLGVTRPLSEHWVLRGFAGYANIPSTVEDSPLVTGNNISLVAATLVYVF